MGGPPQDANLTGLCLLREDTLCVHQRTLAPRPQKPPECLKGRGRRPKVSDDKGVLANEAAPSGRAHITVPKPCRCRKGWDPSRLFPDLPTWLFSEGLHMKGLLSLP